MKILIALLCLSVPITMGMILADLLNKDDMTVLVNTVVQDFGVDVTNDQCKQACVKIFTQYTLDLGCNFACRIIKAEIMRRMHFPTLHPTAAPTPAPLYPLQPTPPE